MCHDSGTHSIHQPRRGQHRAWWGEVMLRCLYRNIHTESEPTMMWQNACNDLLSPVGVTYLSLIGEKIPQSWRSNAGQLHHLTGSVEHHDPEPAKHTGLLISKQLFTSEYPAPDIPGRSNVLEKVCAEAAALVLCDGRVTHRHNSRCAFWERKQLTPHSSCKSKRWFTFKNANLQKSVCRNTER